MIRDVELSEKLMKFGKKLAVVSQKEFTSEPVYSEKYLKTKTQSYYRKVNTNFHNDKISKESSKCIYLLVTLIHSVYRTGKNYYL